MADSTDTTPKPLTDAERKQLEDLQARDQAAAKAAEAQTRKEKLEAMASADVLVKLIKTDKINAAITAALEDPNLSFEYKQRVQGFKSSIEYNIDFLQSTIASLS